jgi:hypothetical protein
MKSTMLTCFGIAAAMLTTAMVLTGSANAGSTERFAPSPSLHGTWRVQVTQYNCQNPSMALPPFWSLLSFHRGGTETETTSNPALEPGQRTAGYGYWERSGNNTYFSVTEAFILFDSSANPPGLKSGVQKILQTIALTDENDFSSIATVKFFNADGTVTTGCAKAQGIRLTGSEDQP